MRNEFYVFKTTIANELLQKGYKLLSVVPNEKQPQKTVFNFKFVDGISEEYNRLREKYWNK